MRDGRAWLKVVRSYIGLAGPSIGRDSGLSFRRIAVAMEPVDAAG